MAAKDEYVPLFCARCAVELRPGSGLFYHVTIEAVADPAPPDLPDPEGMDVRGEIEQLIRRLQGVSEREALEQVHRRLVLHLCARCYRGWIENPTR
jgi:hypothetical protein